MTDPTIYDTLTELVRQYGTIHSSRALNDDEECQVCRWIASEIKLRWSALSVTDRVELVEEYDPKTGEKKHLPTIYVEYTVWPIYNEFITEDEQMQPSQTQKERIAPQLIQGGIMDNTRGYSAQGKMWVQYTHHTLFIWPMRDRVMDDDPPGEGRA